MFNVYCWATFISLNFGPDTRKSYLQILLSFHFHGNNLSFMSKLGFLWILFMIMVYMELNHLLNLI